MLNNIDLFKQRSDEMSAFYQTTVGNLEMNDRSDQLHTWRDQFNQFQEGLNKGEFLHEVDAYERANQLSLQLQSYLEDVSNLDRSERKVHPVPIGGHKL